MRKQLAVGIIAALALTACGGATPAQPSAAPSSSSTTSDDVYTAPDDDPSTPSDDESSDDAGDGTQQFGKGYQWEDGLQVGVSKPVGYKPSEYAATDKGDKYFVIFTITIKNGTKKPFDPTAFDATGSNGDDEAGMVFDVDNDLQGAPDTKILKGKTKKFRVAFGSKTKIKVSNFVLEVTPGFDYDSALFTG